MRQRQASGQPILRFLSTISAFTAERQIHERRSISLGCWFESSLASLFCTLAGSLTAKHIDLRNEPTHNTRWRAQMGGKPEPGAVLFSRLLLMAL